MEKNEICLAPMTDALYHQYYQGFQRDRAIYNMFVYYKIAAKDDADIQD